MKGGTGLRCTPHQCAVCIEGIYGEGVYLLMKGIGEVQLHIVYELQAIVHGAVSLVFVDRITAGKEQHEGLRQ
jgi:hypothetical protein